MARALTKNLKDLTVLHPSELFWVWRRRWNLSQDTAATLLGMPRTRYQQIERGSREERPPANVRTLIPNLTDRLVLARRRCGLGLHPTALAAKTSHVTLLKMEREGDPRLVAFWRRLGYRFP